MLSLPGLIAHKNKTVPVSDSEFDKKKTHSSPKVGGKILLRHVPNSKTKGYMQVTGVEESSRQATKRGEKERKNAFLALVSGACGQLRLQAVRFWSWRDSRPDSVSGSRRDKLSPSGTQCDKPHYSRGGEKKKTTTKKTPTHCFEVGASCYSDGC